jgi:Family of unknown function (DUF6062)
MVRRAPRSSTKFITYFQLLDAFKEAGCPVCSIVERGALKGLDGLMYEQVNDPVTRERLAESHGFCNWHAWMLPRVPNSALGAAVIYRHLLENTLDRLRAALRVVGSGTPNSAVRDRLFGARSDPPTFLDWRYKKAPCPLCKMALHTERNVLTTVLDFIGEPEFSEAFGRSAGLCLPHLTLALEMGRDRPALVPLLNSHRERWETLVWELDEFARKFDYRYADEAKGREGTSWIRALESFVGRVGLFGPERGRATASTLPAAPPPARPQETEQGCEGSRESIEDLRFENDKLKRRVDDLLAEREEDRQARLSLEFQVLKLASDLKAVRMGLDGAAPAEAAPEAGTLSPDYSAPGGSANER